MKKLWIIAGALALVILIIAVCTLTRAPDDVIYNGKSLRDWALQMNVGIGRSQDEAAAQFRALGSNAVPGLVALVRTKDSFLRRGIWAVAPKLPSAFKNAITAHVRPPDAVRIRIAAARSLAAIGHDAQAAVPALARMLQKDQTQGRFEAALALGSIRDAGAAALISASESNDANIRYAAVSGLGNVRSFDNAIIIALLKASTDSSGGISGTAGGVLSRCGTNALPFLKIALENSRPELRRQATRALGSIGAPRDEIVPLLLKMAKDSDPGCRVQATQVLGMSVVPNPTMVAGLVGALDDPEPQVRVAAVQGLRQGHRTDARAAVPALARCLDDSSPLVRELAAQALGAIGTPAKAALPKLVQAADDKEQTVRAAASGAIARIEEQQRLEPRN